MDRIRIRGGRPLQGAIRISGAKNAALPLMTACLLTDDNVVLHNLPQLVDISTMMALLRQHGVAVGDEEGPVTFNAAGVNNTTAPYDIVRKMRASVLVLGPLLARYGRAEVSLPGGCAIGSRPVDYHIRGLEQLGAEVDIVDGYLHARAPKGLRGGAIQFPRVSVGATENLLMAAVLAKGDTVLENAAREPEVTDLANCLIAMGAKIEGIGSDTLQIQGVDRLHGADYTVLPDRVETATYLMAAAITGGDVDLQGADPDLMDAAIATLTDAGVEITAIENGLNVRRNGSRLQATDVTTQPYPGFPTDMQAQIMALLTLADGASVITETIFENRFMHVPELTRLGADIQIKGTNAVVRGVDSLKGAQVMATDLRASVSLVLAGLAAEGETLINRVYHLDRGYERLEEKLSACGADVIRLEG